MAKKKSTQQSQSQTQTQGGQEENMPPPPKNLEPEYIEDPKEKLKRLKSLNSMLLKETVELRQQVDSHMETNASLKSELTRVESEREELKAELTRLADDAVKLEIEGGLVRTFVAAQGKEERERADTISMIDGGTQRRLVEAEELIEILKMEIDWLLMEKGDIEKARGEEEGEVTDLKKRLDEIVVEIEEERGISARVCRERDEAKAQLDAQIEEMNVLSGKLKESEKAEMEKIAIVGEKEELERRVESILREKDEIERSLANSDRVIERLVREKGEIEKVSSEKEAEIGDLRKRLEEIVVEIEKEREVSSRVCRERDEIKRQLVGKIKEADGLMVKLSEAVTREGEIGDDVRALKLAIVEEKEESKIRAELILREKGEIEQSLVKSNSVIDEMNREIEEMVKEKEVIGEEKIVQEREKSELVNTVKGLNALIGGLKEEAELMRQNVVDVQKKRAEGLEKERQMAIKINGLADEKEEMERILESLIEEKSSVMEDFKDAKKKLDIQMQYLEQLSREKIDVEKAKNEAEIEIGLLKKQLSELKDMILSLELSNSLSLERLVEEKSSLMKDLQDAKKNLEFEEQKLEQMSREKIEIDEAKNQAEYEIVELKKQSSECKDAILSLKQSSGVALESLVEEKSSVMKDLHDTRKNMECQILKLEQISQEKIEIEKAKNQAEREIAELKKKLTECNNTFLSIEQSGLAQIDMIKTLESEVRNYKTAFVQTATEKDKAAEGFNEEKLNAMKLREKISEMEKGIEEMQKLLVETKAEGSKVREEKNELESQYAVLKKTITSLEKKLTKSQKDYEDMEAKAGVAEARSELVLSMIKNTAASISVPNGGEMAVRSRSFELVQDKADGEVVKPYEEELDAIKKAFDGRESKVEDMKRQLEFFQNSAQEVHKGRNFWTLVSSVTILAAASIAYVTRAH